jgi:hypothetical protein
VPGKIEFGGRCLHSNSHRLSGTAQSAAIRVN